jgi:hypothetical protein
MSAGCRRVKCFSCWLRKIGSTRLRFSPPTMSRQASYQILVGNITNKSNKVPRFEDGKFLSLDALELFGRNCCFGFAMYWAKSPELTSTLPRILWKTSWPAFCPINGMCPCRLLGYPEGVNDFNVRRLCYNRAVILWFYMSITGS